MKTQNSNILIVMGSVQLLIGYLIIDLRENIIEWIFDYPVISYDIVTMLIIGIAVLIILSGWFTFVIVIASDRKIVGVVSK